VKLFCPMCNAGIRLQDINTRTKMVKCRACRSEFNSTTLIEDHIESAADKANKRRNKQKPIVVSRPNTVTVRADGMDLLLIHKWSVSTGIFALLTGGIVFGIAVANIYFILSGQGFRLMGFMDALLMTMVLGFFLILGASTLIKGMYNLLNSTTLRLSHDTITLKHHPLPWKGKTLGIEGLQQVFVRQHPRGKQGTVYSLNVINKDDTQVQLQYGLQENVALYIEQEIEKQLGIEDVPVRREYLKRNGGLA
jgi:hypothetical protein